MAAVGAATLLPAAPALGVQRHASPAGLPGECSQANPCDIETAVGLASDGDEVILAPGDYGTPDAPLASEIAATSAIEVHGAAGGPRPRIHSFAVNVFRVGPGASLRDVEIQSVAFNGLQLEGLAERVFIRSPDSACTLAGDRAVLRDSVCWSTQSAPAVGMTASGTMQLPLSTGTLLNVTAYSTSGDGIRATAGNFAELAISATNVIAHGGSRDVRADVTGSMGARSAGVVLDHSNYATRQQIGGGTVTAPGSGTNQTASPMFADDPLGDFHQLAASPTIDAGITDAANGVADFDGETRAQGAGTDIGADEFLVVPAPPAPVVGQAPRDTTKPAARGLRLRPQAFAATRGRGQSIISARRRVRRSASVRYRVSEAATLTFTIQRSVISRRGRSRGRRVWRRVRGSFQHPGRKGLNRFRFSGRLNGRRLRPARYRLLGVPRDPAGNRGKSVRAGFRVVRV